MKLFAVPVRLCWQNLAVYGHPGKRWRQWSWEGYETSTSWRSGAEVESGKRHTVCECRVGHCHFSLFCLEVTVTYIWSTMVIVCWYLPQDVHSGRRHKGPTLSRVFSKTFDDPSASWTTKCRTWCRIRTNNSYLPSQFRFLPLLENSGFLFSDWCHNCSTCLFSIAGLKCVVSWEDTWPWKVVRATVTITPIISTVETKAKREYGGL